MLPIDPCLPGVPFRGLAIDQAEVTVADAHLIRFVLASDSDRQVPVRGGGPHRGLGPAITREVVSKIAEDPGLVLAELKVELRWRFEDQQVVNAVLVVTGSVGIQAVQALAAERL